MGPFSPHISLLFSSKSWQNEVCHAWLHCQKVFAFLWHSTYTWKRDTSFNFLKYPKGEISQGILQEYFVEEKNRDICIWSKIFQFSRMDPNGIYDITSSIFSPSFLRCDFFFVPFLWVSSWQIALLFKAFTIPIGMHWPKQWGAKVETMNQKMDSISKSMLRLNCELHFVWLYWGKHRRMMRCSLIRNKGEPFRKTNVSASNPLTVLFGDISE